MEEECMNVGMRRDDDLVVQSGYLVFIELLLA